MNVCGYLQLFAPMSAGKMNQEYILCPLHDFKNLLIIGKLTALSEDRKDMDKIILKVIK